MYSANGEMDGLSSALTFAFKQSARVKGPEAVDLREILTARGAGFSYTSAYKMEHDIMQLEVEDPCSQTPAHSHSHTFENLSVKSSHILEEQISSVIIMPLILQFSLDPSTLPTKWRMKTGPLGSGMLCCQRIEHYWQRSLPSKSCTAQQACLLLPRPLRRLLLLPLFTIRPLMCQTSPHSIAT